MNYEYQGDLTRRDAVAYLHELAGSSKKAPEIGAGSGMITKRLVKTKGCDVVPVEINPVSVEKTEILHRPGLCSGSQLSGLDKSLAGEEKFDAIIAVDELKPL